MATSNALVYGERIYDLLPVLRKLTETWRLNNEGMCELYSAFDAHVAVPFFRALLRAEAELLLEEADALVPGDFDHQFGSGQRSADALVRLAEAVCTSP